MSKVIWYCHHYAGSPSIGMSYRPYYLTKEFNKLGHRAYVIGASFHHLMDRKLNQSEPVKLEELDGVPFIWLKTPRYQGNGLGRLANMFSYTTKLWSRAKQIISFTQKPDVIIVSSPHLIHYLSAHLIAKKYGCQLIFEVRDIWPLSLVEILNVSKKHPLILLMDWIESKAYKEADIIVSLLPNALPHMEKKGCDPQRFAYIPNGTVIPETFSPRSEFDLIKQLKHQKKFLIGYLGAHGVPNALDQLVSALSLLQQQGNSNIHAILVGKGLEKENLKKQAQHLNNITFCDPIPKEQVPHFLSTVDAAFIGWKALPLYQFGISPNKIFDYMVAEKPIVHAINTSSDLVQSAECGITVPAENPAALAQALLKMAALSEEERKQMGEKGRKYVRTHHNYETLTKQYVGYFEVT